MPDFYLRYYAFCWLIGQISFYMNNPIAATAVFSTDLRVKEIRPSSDSTAVTLYYPQWTARGIHGDYLSVDATPIIRLLMGKGLYKDTEHVWFRTLWMPTLRTRP